MVPCSHDLVLSGTAFGGRKGLVRGKTPAAGFAFLAGGTLLGIVAATLEVAMRRRSKSR